MKKKNLSFQEEIWYSCISAYLWTNRMHITFIHCFIPFVSILICLWALTTFDLSQLQPTYPLLDRLKWSYAARPSYPLEGESSPNHAIALLSYRGWHLPRKAHFIHILHRKLTSNGLESVWALSSSSSRRSIWDCFSQRLRTQIHWEQSLSKESSLTVEFSRLPSQSSNPRPFQSLQDLQWKKVLDPDEDWLCGSLSHGLSGRWSLRIVCRPKEPNSYRKKQWENETHCVKI